jgi:hypothetical protein
MNNPLIHACFLLFLLGSSAAGSLESAEPNKSPEVLRSAASTEEIKAWIEARKGYGYPDYLEARLANLEVFVAWNIPTSGWNGTDYWVYCRRERATAWHLIESSWFQPRNDRAHSAVVDPRRRKVRFLGPRGETFKTVSVRACPRD